MDKDVTAEFGLLSEAPKGIVDPASTVKRIRLTRLKPSARLISFFDVCWIVEWNREGRPPETQRVLPYPNANLVFDYGRTALFGIVTGAFDRLIKGSGRVLGLRFRVGGLRPFLGGPVTELTDKERSASGFLRCSTIEAEQAVLSCSTTDAMARCAEALVAERLPAPDPTIDEIARILAIVEPENGPTRVEELAKLSGYSTRALQRLFHDYVGVSPKWVIQRYRLQEAAWRLAREECNLSDLAVTLGYYDQAHLTREFAALVGMTPAVYRAAQRHNS